MAHNPFRVFRKYQKQSLAVLGVSAMVLFVIDPSMFMGSGRVPSDSVVTSDYGNVTTNQLQQLRGTHMALSGFFEQVATTLQQAGAPVDPELQEFYGVMLADSSNKGIIRRWMLAKKAEAEGMQVTDADANTFLGVLVGENVSNEKVLSLLEASGFTQRQLIDTLKTYIMAYRLEQAFRSSLTPVTPGERWDAYLKFERKAAIEGAAIDVDRFLDQVADPDNETIKTFFEENKYRLVNPSSPEPGFRQPTRLAVEYVIAKMDPASIPMSEVEAYYEEHKEAEFKSLGLPPTAGPMTPASPGDALDAEHGTLPGMDDQPPASTEEAPAEEESPAPATDADAPKPAEEAKPETPVDETKDAEQPAEEKPATDDGAMMPMIEDLQPVAYQAPEGDTAVDANADAGDAAPATEAAPAGDVAEPTTPAEGETPEAAEEAPPTYRPLSEVEGRIRDDLARAKIQQSFDELRKKMDEYNSLWIEWQKGDSDEPTPVDLKAFAEAHGFGYMKTKPLSQYEMRDLDIDRSVVGGWSRSQDFARSVFSKSRIYAPGQSDTQDEMFLYWITERESERVPELTDEGIREQVVREWKRIRARELAVEEANRLAEDARKKGGSLAEVFADDSNVGLFKTDRFSWYNDNPYMLQFGRMDLLVTPSQIEELDENDVPLERPKYLVAPGEDFKAAVFALDVGGVGVAMNQPENTAYVVRMTWSTEMTELWTGYTADVVSPLALMQVARQYSIVDPQDDWYKSLEKDANLVWHRDEDEL